MAPKTSENVDADELKRFEAQAKQWWDPKGEFGALHDINPLRAGYVADRTVLRGANLLDVGCGGGILSEALAAKGADVTGIDLGETALGIARNHVRSSGLSITYRRSSAEALALAEPARYDVVVCMELLEHVPEPASIVRACAGLVRPGGDVFFSTLNRTPLAGLLAIFMAETVLGVVARGTHHYDKFVRPSDLESWAKTCGLALRDFSGFLYLPFFRVSRLTRGTPVNYLAHFERHH